MKKMKALVAFLVALAFTSTTFAEPAKSDASKPQKKPAPAQQSARPNTAPAVNPQNNCPCPPVSRPSARRAVRQPVVVSVQPQALTPDMVVPVRLGDLTKYLMENRQSTSPPVVVQSAPVMDPTALAAFAAAMRPVSSPPDSGLSTKLDTLIELQRKENELTERGNASLRTANKWNGANAVLNGGQLVVGVLQLNKLGRINKSMGDMAHSADLMREVANSKPLQMINTQTVANAGNNTLNNTNTNTSESNSEGGGGGSASVGDVTSGSSSSGGNSNSNAGGGNANNGGSTNNNQGGDNTANGGNGGNGGAGGNNTNTNNGGDNTANGGEGGNGNGGNVNNPPPPKPKDPKPEPPKPPKPEPCGSKPKVPGQYTMNTCK
jgi:hypothetical protein